MKRQIIFLGAAICWSVLFSFIVRAQEAVPQEGGKQVIEYLEFREVDIKDVLRQLARQYDLNIVFSESVSGLITVQLHNVTVQEALDSVITINGFVYTKKGEVFKVTTPAESEREGKQTKVYRLSNADAEVLKTSLGKMLSAEGSIESDTRSNSLIINDNPGVISKVDEMMPDLDDVTPQVLIEARFIETALGTTENLGIDWTATATATGSKRPTTFPFKNWGREQDYYPAPEHETETDFTNNHNTVTSEFAFKNETVYHPDDSFAFSAFPAVSGSEFTFGTLDFSAFQAILQMLHSKTDSKLISSPRVVTMDNKKAEMYVGKARPIPQFEFNSDTGEYQINGFEEKIEGVTLSVTPQISKDSSGKYSIRLKLMPKVTSFSGETVPFTGLNFNYPVLSERYADTEVSVKDGDTIVIGGLMERKKTEIVKKVPFLGSIPFIGKALFTHTEINPDEKSELLIFVTARIVREEEGSPLAFESNLSVSPLRPFKKNIRKVNAQ